MTNIFNISETHYYEQRAQLNITNFFDNKFFDTLLRTTKVFYMKGVYRNLFIYGGIYRKLR